jgi:hypothetical protein
MARIHVSKDPSNQLAITLSCDFLLTTNLKPILTKQIYFASPLIEFNGQGRY